MQVLWRTRCTDKADIWSYGIFLNEIITAQKPVRGDMADIRYACTLYLVSRLTFHVVTPQWHIKLLYELWNRVAPSSF